MKKSLLKLKGPFDLALSLQAAASFSPDTPELNSVLLKPVRIDGEPVVIEIRQVEARPAVLEVSADGSKPTAQIKDAVKSILLADLDLRPFYDLVAGDGVLEPIATQLHGLKPMRPASLFEMAVIAITEQQISILAAQKIRSRLIERFGEKIGDYWLFPTAQSLAGVSLEEIMSCGLSTRKAEYIKGLAEQVADGTLELEALKDLPDDEVRSLICQIRGFGRWSADYILIRGLGSPDVVPVDDLGIRTFTGVYLGDGSRMSAQQVALAFEPYAPFRGIAMFYLMVHHRLFAESVNRNGLLAKNGS